MARTGFISTTGVAKRPRSDWDRAIGAIAARQHGVVTHAQLVALGMGSSTIRARVAANRLHRLHHGVFAVGYLPLVAHGYWAAAVLACGPGAVLSFASCGALHEIRPSSATLIDVTTPGRVGRRRDGLRIHPAATIVPSDLTVVAGIPCTTIARTICDLAGVVSQDATEYMVHRAQAKRVFVRAEVEAIVRRSPSRRGTRALRRILSISDRSEDEVRSGLERLMLRICRTSGLPQPEVDHWIALPDGGGYEVDFCWPDRGLVVEVDSRRFHDTDRGFENDRLRDRRLALAGWRVVRFTERDLCERPDDVERQLHALLRDPAPIR